MAEPRRINRMHRSLSRPLTILGAERKLFFFAMCLGAATFNLLNSLLGGLLIFFLLYCVARWATETDPQILRFLLTAAKVRAQYDPMKLTPITVRRGRPCSGLAGSSKTTTRPALSAEQINLVRIHRTVSLPHQDRGSRRHSRSARCRLRMPRQFRDRRSYQTSGIRSETVR